MNYVNNLGESALSVALETESLLKRKETTGNAHPADENIQEGIRGCQFLLIFRHKSI